MEAAPKRLGEYLLEKGLITIDQLNQALKISDRNQRLGEVLVDLGFINLRQLTDAILEQQKSHSPIRKRLGEILLESGIITEDQLSEALNAQKNRRQKIGEILVSLGYVTKDQITDALSEKLNIPIIPCERLEIDNELKNIIPQNIAEKYNIFPIKKDGNILTIAIADPLDYKAIDDISFMTRLKINTLMAYEWAIRKAIETNYKKEETEDVFQEIHTEINVDKEIQFKEEKDVEDMNVEVLYTKSKAPTVVKLVAMIVANANKVRASDIHIEPRETSVIVRYRVDGELRKAFKYSKDLHDSVVSRIKIISKLDITNRRVPQDGSVRVSLKGKEIDLRISTLPSIYGEKVVMRLLDQSHGVININELAMPDSIKKSLLSILHSPQGMLLVTGPTGSGKTTTLYACLHEIKSITKNIITIEDPVEYKIDSITQTEVNEAVGRTFASILRAVLRQDPDIIMVGEIRDLETAEIAIKASLTGHLVLSTLHTNNTIATITRLIDIGIPPYLVSSAVSGVLAQRLVKRVCIHCKVQIDVSDELKDRIDILGLPPITKHYIGAGCPKCTKTGYSGRVGIYEFLPMSQTIRRLISKNAGEDQLLSEAKKAGATFFFEDAWNKVKFGITTIDEVMTKIPMDYVIRKQD